MLLLITFKKRFPKLLIGVKVLYLIDELLFFVLLNFLRLLKPDVTYPRKLFVAVFQDQIDVPNDF
jgi:hypothetical protein